MTTVQQEQLKTYLTLLLKANQEFNLTAIRSFDEGWERLIEDSLRLLPWIGEHEKILDVGSGGGAPGIPVAIMRPKCSVTLVESLGKKCNFLNGAVEILALKHVCIIQDRAESLGHDPEYREDYSCVTARAVAKLRVLLEYLFPFAKVGGKLLMSKGKKVVEEMYSAQHVLKKLGGDSFITHEFPETSKTGGCVVEVNKIKPTPEKYPRAAGIPAKNPL